MGTSCELCYHPLQLVLELLLLLLVDFPSVRPGEPVAMPVSQRVGKSPTPLCLYGFHFMIRMRYRQQQQQRHPVVDKFEKEVKLNLFISNLRPQ